MRMWMVDPKIMCNRHLLGEHVECHMFVGTILKNKSLQGYIDNKLLFIGHLANRHQALVEEMIRRGFNHKSELLPFDSGYMEGRFYLEPTISIIEYNQLDLWCRCKDCYQRAKEANLIL